MKQKLTKTSLGNSPPKRKINFTFLIFNTLQTLKTIQLIIAFSLLSFLTTNAQITKGNWIVGGTGSFYNYQLKENKINTNSGIGMELRPNLGYFIVDKFAIGISPLLAYSKPENGSSVTSFGVELYIRYYILNPEKRINILTHAGYAYSGSNNSNDNSTAFDFKAGPVIFFNSSVALEMTLNYNLNKLNSTTNYNIFSLGLGFQIHLEK